MDIGDKLKGLHISDNFGDSHHHSWPFAGIINFDSVMQGLVDVNYDGIINNRDIIAIIQKLAGWN